MGGEALRMKLLVLGRNGQVGWELQRSLAPLGDVVALSRADADLEDIDALLQIVGGSVRKCWSTPLAIPRSTRRRASPIEPTRSTGQPSTRWRDGQQPTDARLVHYSTDYVFDGRKPTPYVESDDTAPQSVYGRTKRDGEVAIIASGCQHLIFQDQLGACRARKQFCSHDTSLGEGAIRTAHCS